MSTRLLATASEGILVLTLESDDGLPRIERSVLQALSTEIEKLAASRGLRGCIVTGSERAFAVGADIAELARLSPAEAFDFSREGQRAFCAIERSPRPVVAAIRGYCMGGGLDLALSCHSRIATPDAVFAHPGGALGILTGWGGTQRLTRLIGRARATEMLTTGDKITAEQASSWGLLNRVTSAASLPADAERFILLRQNSAITQFRI